MRTFWIHNIMTICMHTIHSCQNTSRQYSSTSPTPCKPTHPQTHSFQPLSDSFNLSMDTPYNIPNGAMQHRQSMARYFVINLFFLILVIIILFIKEQQQFHFILSPINIINPQPNKYYKCTTLCMEQGFFLFELLLFLGEKKDCVPVPAPVAQWLARRTVGRKVWGSNPIRVMWDFSALAGS